MNPREADVRVLHVDDEPGFGEIASSLLERSSDSISVTVESDPRLGVEHVESGSIDCVLSDYEMASMNGIEFLREVRTVCADLPFILLTGRGDEALADEALSAGATDYFRKETEPEQFAILANRIERVVADRRRRDELARKSSLLDSIFESIPVHLYVKDENARHVLVSGAVFDDPDAIVGKRDIDIDGPWVDHAENGYEDDLHVIETGEAILNKEEFIPATDTWNLTSKVPWKNADGKVVGLIGVTRDITEQKHREQRLNRQNERLDEFASIVSHDLRNPLNVAHGNLELAQSECDSEYVVDAMDALDRMYEIVHDVLALAQNGRIVVDEEPVDLAATAREAWSTVETPNGELSVGSLPTVAGDGSRIRRLFENLFRNSIEHGSTSPHTTSAPEDQNEPITVSVGELDDETGFFVADDGSGIPEEDRESVLEPGYSTGGGSGFGLAIVKSIAEAHDWRVSITEIASGGFRIDVTDVGRYGETDDRPAPPP